MTTIAVEPGPTDLFNYSFVFAVQKVDPRIGTIRVESVYWDRSSSKEKTPMEMVDCNELRPGGKYEAFG